MRIANFQLPIADLALSHGFQIGNRKSALGNVLLLLAFLRLSLFFLLALADNFGFGRRFAFDWSHCCYRLFLDNTHGRDRRIGICQNFNADAHRNVRNVQHIVHCQICNIDLQRFRNLAGFAADFDVPNNLFEHTSLLTHTNRFSNETQGHRRFDLSPFTNRLKSAWIRRMRTGSIWRSTNITSLSPTPSTSIVKIVLRPVSDRRMAANSRNGASADTAPPSPP